jgi:signal transduction histidine kinase
MASVAILTVFGGEIPPRLKQICVGVIIASTGVIAAAAFKILYDIATAFTQTTEKARQIARAGYDTRLMPRTQGGVPDEAAVEEQELSNSLNTITDRLHEYMEEVRVKARELEAANTQLKRLDQLKSDFLSSVSHELRTPLTSIRSFSEILLKYEDEDIETRRRFLNIVNNESVRLTELINDVLDLSKIESGRMFWDMKVCDPSEIVRNAEDTVGPIAADKGIRVVSETPDGAPKVFADRDRIVQVLMNLLSNALKFSDEGKTVRISLETGGADASEVGIGIKDEGVGIPEEELPTVFDKFVQVRSKQTGKPRGTGLGLAICREIVEAHGGRISVESRVGAGSAFTVLLPVWRGGGDFDSLLDWKMNQAKVSGRPVSVLLVRLPEGDYTKEQIESVAGRLLGEIGEEAGICGYRKTGYLGAVLLADEEAARAAGERIAERIGRIAVDGLPRFRREEIRTAAGMMLEPVSQVSDVLRELEEECEGRGKEAGNA